MVPQPRRGACNHSFANTQLPPLYGYTIGKDHRCPGIVFSQYMLEEIKGRGEGEKRRERRWQLNMSRVVNVQRRKTFLNIPSLKPEPVII